MTHTDAALLVHLLRPKLQAVNSTWSRGGRMERLKYAFFAVLGFGFWVMIYGLTFVLLDKVAAEQVYGDFLMGKLLSFLAMLFFAVLVFSNMVTSLSAFFLSEDLQIHFTTPVPLGTLYIARFVETVVASSWMVLLFAVPILIAYGKVLGASILYYPWMVLALMAFLLLPAAIGTMVSMFLVKAFPARKLHDVLIIAAALMVISLYLLFRFLRPEQLFNPDLFAGFAEYFATLRTPDTYFAPATWLSQSILSALHGSWTEGFFFLGLLAANGLMVIVVSQWLALRIYPDAFSKAQEGRRLRFTGSGPFERAVQSLGSLFTSQTRQLVMKDVRNFFRETTQWTQSLLLLGLMIVYVFNFKVLRLDRIAGITAYHINLVAFVNIVLAAFVIAAVSVRFVLPMVSLEGQAIWIIRTAPLKPAGFLWSKYFLALAPLLLIAEALILLSNYYLSAAPLLFWVSAFSIFFLTIGTTAMAVGLGAKYPNFREQNIARLSTGASSIIYMILAMVFVVLVVLVEFLPVRSLYMAIVSQSVPDPRALYFLAGSLFVVAVMSCACTIYFMRLGVRSLSEMGL